jgi:hypothetical protein
MNMAFERLKKADQETFAELPEIAMDLQIGKRPDGEFVLVIGGRVGLTYDEGLTAQMAKYRALVGDPVRAGSATHDARSLDWLGSLPEAGSLEPVAIDQALTALRLIHLGPRGKLPPAPMRPPYIYGHLPFHGVCGGSDNYYRYEHFPTSLRIDQANQRVIKPDTYAAPESELAFTPTGLSAVARFALPSLLPACWCWKLQPKKGTVIHYGASVPLYGQSGGGVEVCFPKPFDNAVPILNPNVLNIL